MLIIGSLSCSVGKQEERWEWYINKRAGEILVESSHLDDDDDDNESLFWVRK